MVEENSPDEEAGKDKEEVDSGRGQNQGRAQVGKERAGRGVQRRAQFHAVMEENEGNGDAPEAVEGGNSDGGERPGGFGRFRAQTRRGGFTKKIAFHSDSNAMLCARLMTNARR